MKATEAIEHLEAVTRQCFAEGASLDKDKRETIVVGIKAVQTMAALSRSAQAEEHARYLAMGREETLALMRETRAKLDAKIEQLESPQDDQPFSWGEPASKPSRLSAADIRELEVMAGDREPEPDIP